MLKSFFLISLRNILKNKGGAWLNLVGLTLGMAACLFIFNYLFFEHSYDQFYDPKTVFRVETHTTANGLISRSAYTTPTTYKHIEESHAIRSFTRLIPFSEESSAMFRRKNHMGREQVIHIEKVYFGEPSLFEVLQTPLIEGEENSALKSPNSIILSLSTVQRVFPEKWKAGESVLGTLITSAGTGIANDIYTITGVFADRPANTHMKFGAIASLSSSASGIENSKFLNFENTYTYVLSDRPILNTQQSGYIVPSQKKLFLRPVEEIHTATETSNEPSPLADEALLIFLGVIGIIIILLASTNYVNNAIVNSIFRTKEIGVRKLLGIKPGQLITTFIGEAFLVNLIAGLLSIFVYRIGVQLLIVWTEIDYPVNDGASMTTLILFTITLVIICTLLSGIYPALHLSALSPVESLRSQTSFSGSQMSRSGGIIKSLLIFQLSASIIFLAGVYVVHKQLKYMKQQESSPFELKIGGIFPGSSNAGPVFTNKAEGLISRLRRDELITEVLFSNLKKGLIKTTQQTELLSPRDVRYDSLNNTYQFYVVDHSYWSPEDSAFVAGQNFSPAFGRDFNSLIINTSALQQLGYHNPDSIIGKSLMTRGGIERVTGVVKNETSSDPPAVFVTGFRYLTYVDLTINYPGRAGESPSQFITRMEKVLSARLPFLYLFDRSYDQQIKTEHTMLVLFMFFSFLTLAIACMGMFGLSLFVTQKRSSEIGLRKIFGATIENILLILLYDFLKLVAYASAFAVPVILTGSKMWLENYTFRIRIDPMIIGVPVLIVLGVCIIVVAKKCLDLAVRSPVYSLREN